MNGEFRDRPFDRKKECGVGVCYTVEVGGFH